MLIRKTALAAASLAATLAGANQAEAGLFGRRICCPATPVQCPPVIMAPTMQWHASSQQVYSYPNSYIEDPCRTVNSLGAAYLAIPVNNGATLPVNETGIQLAPGESLATDRQVLDAALSELRSIREKLLLIQPEQSRQIPSLDTIDAKLEQYKPPATNN